MADPVANYKKIISIIKVPIVPPGCQILYDLPILHKGSGSETKIGWYIPQHMQENYSSMKQHLEALDLATGFKASDRVLEAFSFCKMT